MEKSCLTIGIPGGICASKNTSKTPQTPPKISKYTKYPQKSTNTPKHPNPPQLCLPKILPSAHSRSFQEETLLFFPKLILPTLPHRLFIFFCKSLIFGKRQFWVSYLIRCFLSRKEEPHRMFWVGFFWGGFGFFFSAFKSHFLAAKPSWKTLSWARLEMWVWDWIWVQILEFLSLEVSKVGIGHSLGSLIPEISPKFRDFGIPASRFKNWEKRWNSEKEKGKNLGFQSSSTKISQDFPAGNPRLKFFQLHSHQEGPTDPKFTRICPNLPRNEGLASPRWDFGDLPSSSSSLWIYRALNWDIPGKSEVFPPFWVVPPFFGGWSRFWDVPRSFEASFSPELEKSGKFLQNRIFPLFLQAVWGPSAGQRNSGGKTNPFSAIFFPPTAFQGRGSTPCFE